ncbi:MAG TPA: hypothetical protein VGD31_14995, partial [Sphingobacteriaceae bacterium]
STASDHTVYNMGRNKYKSGLFLTIEDWVMVVRLISKISKYRCNSVRKAQNDIHAPKGAVYQHLSSVGQT